MKLTLLIVTCLFIFTCGYSQTPNPPPLPEISEARITLESPGVRVATKSTISEIIVIDSRFDSSSLGFYQANSGKNHSIIAETGLTREISTFLKDYLQASHNGKTIVMVLKKLWLSNECIEESIEGVSKKTPTGTWLKGVITKFEFYGSYEDGYTPLYRFDSIFSGTTNIKDYSVEYLRDALIASVQKLMMADLNNFSTSRKKMSLQDIVAYNNQQFNIPVTGTNMYTKGVYKTFAEFKANSPSFLDYEIRKDDLTETIFVKNENADYPLRDIWGYCDGTNLYIKSADNYFRLFKKQNTFLCYGAKDLTRNRNIKWGNVLVGGIVGGGLGKGNKKVSYTLHRRMYELDMETGELF